MKLLLTSGGLSNPTIKKSLLDLTRKKPEKITVAFIPTAADPEKDKWFVESAIDEINEMEMNLKMIDLKDENESSLKERLSGCDVIYVNGGNTFYLLDWVRKSGFDKILTSLLKTKVYVGVSAGSILVGPSIEISGLGGGDKNIVDIKDLSGLNFVDFAILPHYEEQHRKELEIFAKKVTYSLYALDNSMAVMVDNGRIKLVGEGVGFKLK